VGQRGFFNSAVVSRRDGKRMMTSARASAHPKDYRMTSQRLLLAPLFLFIVFNLTWGRINALSHPAVTGENRSSLKSEQSAEALSIALEKGLLQVRTPLGVVLSGMKLRLRFNADAVVAGDLELSAQDAGTDAAGKYERQRYRFKLAAASQALLKDSVNVVLEIRHYLEPETIVAFLDYDGPALAARDSIQLIMGLDSFARGMALKRLKLYWTSPVFISDPRLLSSSNQLLLWRQLEGDNYHLLVPLAGDGMIGEVGVSEIDYRYEFRISSSSYDPAFKPHRVPLFAYATSDDPYRLPVETYRKAFAASEQYGRLRWQKSYPEIFSWLGWCSWNAYGHEVTEEKILASVRSLQDKGIPLGFVLVDDGWLSTKDSKLVKFNADEKKFPHDLSGLARTLREQYRIPHVGVWHTFQGYWSGVDGDSEIGRSHQLFKGLEGKALPDPRNGAGESFYADWYRSLKEWGFDFVKVDGQGNNIKFTNGLMPLFASGGGAHRNFQEAARKYFSDSEAQDGGRAAGLNVINCMEMSLENVYNWRISNVARNSDDYLPDNPQNAKEHIYQNAYNSYWTSNFAYPDWDMFQSHDPHADYHAIARAISGGPVYITDQPGKERAEILRPLAFSDGRLLMLDEPGQVTRDILFTDVALEPLPLKVFGLIKRPGLTAGMVAAFNVNKSAQNISGRITASDVPGINGPGKDAPEAIAVYQRSTGRAMLLDEKNAGVGFGLGGFGYDLFTLAQVWRGAAIFGLLDKYLGPAAVVSQRVVGNQINVRLREAGDFGAWLERAPAGVKVDGRELPTSAYSYEKNLLRVPQASFSKRKGEREITIVLASARAAR
jgi:raffinose synthase